MSRRLIHARHKSEHFQSAPTQKHEKLGNSKFRNESHDQDLALRSERESTGLNQTETFMFEYWSCFLVLVNF